MFPYLTFPGMEGRLESRADPSQGEAQPKFIEDPLRKARLSENPEKSEGKMRTGDGHELPHQIASCDRTLALGSFQSVKASSTMTERTGKSIA